MTNDSTPTPITEAELAELERLAGAATEGPWKCENGFVCGPDHTGKASYARGASIAQMDSDPLAGVDAPFIVASRTAVPRLIERIRELQGEVERLKLIRPQWILDKPLKEMAYDCASNFVEFPKTRELAEVEKIIRRYVVIPERLEDGNE
jgi:hypothetical protein